MANPENPEWTFRVFGRTRWLRCAPAPSTPEKKTHANFVIKIGWTNKWFPCRDESNPYFLWVLSSWEGPAFAIFSINHQRETQHCKCIKSIKCMKWSVWLDIPRDIHVLWQVNGLVLINRWEVVAWTQLFRTCVLNLLGTPRHISQFAY